MNSAILQRLIWKEYRVLRSFWLATLVLAAFAIFAWSALAKWYQRPVQVDDFFVLAAAVTSLFALGVGGTLFSTEHEVGTAEFLRRLPLDARHLWLGKLALAFLSVIGLKAVLWSVAGFIALLVPGHGEQLQTIWWCSWVSELELFAWAAMLSLLSRQPLMAITWAITVSSIIIHMVLPFLWPVSRLGALHRPVPQVGLLIDYDFALPERTVFALGLLALTAALSTKWLRSPQPLSLLPDWWRQRSLRRRTGQQLWFAAPATAQLSAATTSGQLTRLMWLQWRQSRWLWVSLAVPFVASSVWKLMTTLRTENVELLFAISTGILWLGLGVNVFHGQQAQFRFRYFAEHGISPARVWCGLQLALMLPLAVSIGLIVIVICMSGNFPRMIDASERLKMLAAMIGGLSLLASIVFATGQLVGLLFRQAMIAVAMCIVGLAIHGCWWFLLMNSVSDPGVWFPIIWVAPFPIAWMWLSRRHVSNWILERRTRATRLRLGLCLVAPWLLMSAGLMAYRVLELPNIEIEPPTREQLLTLSDEERQTAEMYQAVIQSLGVELTGQPMHDKLTKELDQRLRQSPEFLEKILAVTRRPTGALPGDPEAQQAAAQMLLLVLERAELLANEVESLERIVDLHRAMRQLLRHWRTNTNFEGLRRISEREGNDLDRLASCLKAAPGQPERYRALASRLADWNEPDQNSWRAWEWAYRDALDLRNKPDWRQHFHSDRNIELNYPSLNWLHLIPGERERARRILKLQFANQLRNEQFHRTPSIARMGRQQVDSWMNRLTWLDSWGRLLAHHIQIESNARFSSKFNFLPVVRWRMLQAWLEIHAVKLETQEWPASSEGIPSLGRFSRLPPERDGWIEFYPKGLWSGRDLEPTTVSGVHGKRLTLQGDEPCLVYYFREEFRSLLQDASSAEKRETLATYIVVDFLEPQKLAP